MSGDYCIPYGISHVLSLRDPSNEGYATGFETPTPYSSYQQWDEHGDVCQANGTVWGEEVHKSECNLKTCGMHHYVSLGEQGETELPWGAPFGNPSLIVSAEADIQTLTSGGDAAWGYICPLFQATGSPTILEYCLEEWRGPGNEEPAGEDEKIGTCATAKKGNVNLDTVQTFFEPGTRFATKQSGSAETHVAAAGWKKYIAAITPSNLLAAIELDRVQFKEKKESHSGETTPEIGYGCGRSTTELPSNPADYALVGIEQGAEGWNFTEIGTADANMQLYTEFTPHAPEISTGNAPEAEYGVAKFEGSVNPNGYKTEAWIEYGEKSVTESSAGIGSIGSGITSVPVSVLQTLTPGVTYHYRVTARSSVGEEHGIEKTLKLRSRPKVVTEGASERTGESLTVTGNITPYTSTSYYFEYGKHCPTECPEHTTTAKLEAGESPVGVKATITGLHPSTDVTYRLHAENEMGSSTGEPKEAATLNEPIATTVYPATSIGKRQVTLEGEVQPRGTDTHYFFEYGKTSFTNTIPVEPGTDAGAGETTIKVSVPVTGLAAGTSYNYRLVANSSVGRSVGATKGFSTLAPEQCEGENITGQGASSEKLAQTKVWAPNFNTSTNAYACSGTQGSKGKPVISYHSSSSGAGLRSWGAEIKESKEVSFAPTNAFIGTLEAPNATQTSEVLSHESPRTEATLATIPTAQFALAIYVHLPTGCTANNEEAEGRLVLTDALLEGIYTGTVKKWGQLAVNGNTITGTGCSEATITPIVRKEQAGTTSVLKKFLYELNSATLTTAKGSETWQQLAEGLLNTVWPSALTSTATTTEGDAAEAEKVSATAGSIGYSNLAELRATGLFSPATAGKFWVELERSSKTSKGKTTYQYADPASNEDVAAAGNANCNNTVYENNKKVFPPANLESVWSEVSAEIVSSTYPLCGFTYVLAFTEYHLLPGTTETEAISVNNYLQFIASIATGGGGKLIGESHDYAGLPAEVATEVATGAAQVKF